MFILAGFPLVAQAAPPEKLTEESTTVEYRVDADDERVMKVEDEIDRIADDADLITPGFGVRIAQCVSDIIDGVDPTAAPAPRPLPEEKPKPPPIDWDDLLDPSWPDDDDDEEGDGEGTTGGGDPE